MNTLAYDWGTIKILSEKAVTGGESMSFGMVVLAPGKGHDRHNHPGSDEIFFYDVGR
ncbi:MAG: cupin, partial [Chloroflexaceae bacterium]|nr:cupin [Chloroflexaceae bacterium]